MTPSTTPTAITPDALKAGHRTMWASGDYASVATHVDAAPAATLLEHIGDVADRDVLDVATGSGNLALRLAARGARVTGLDLVDELLDTAREREATAALPHPVTWIQGDAERLPFTTAAFDLTTSIFGIQFAPRHQVAADELLRVTRPGGTIALVNWTPGGLIGRMFGVLGQHLPKPPAFASPPPLWGDPEHVADLFQDGVVSLETVPGVNTFRFPSLDAFATFFEDNYGPMLTAQAKLQSQWPACRDSLRELYAELGRTTPNGFELDSDFHLFTARRATAR